MICAVVVASHGAERQVLRGHVPREVSRLQPIARLSGSTNLQLAIGLPLRNRERLTNLLARIYDPSSPDYRHYLTPQEFTGDFGPSEADYEAIKGFAKANGLQVTATHPNRLLLDVSGSVADIERTFHVAIQIYQHPTEHRTFYAPDTEPSIDLTVPVLKVSGLDNYSLPQPRLKTVTLVSGRNASPLSGSGPQGAYMGNDFRAAYLPGTTLSGAGQSVGLLQFDGYSASDISNYEAAAGLPSVTLSNVLIDGFSGQPSGSGQVEVSLDIEMAISMAPGLSQVILYEAPNPSPFEDILNRMATDDAAQQLSCSWFKPNGGPDPVADEIFQEMAAQGQSFVNASGDSDAWTGLIDFPGETPYITQVGGTMLTTTSPGGEWASETVWNRGNGVGSSGGISMNYPIPFWQTNVSMANNQGSTTMRNIPDVALTAENVYVRAAGEDLSVGGTSCAAPLWAGFIALVNQQAAINSNAPLGFLNPTLYQIGTGAEYLSTFHDITAGDNTSTVSPSKFFAASGYDLCTGWGTPAGQGLIDALALPPAATPPSILSQPQDETVATGSNAVFFITATGSPTLQYQWSFDGTNIDGATNSFLALLNVQPNQAGSYAVQITNDFGSAMSSNAALTVELPIPPVIITQPLDQISVPGGVGFFSVIVTGSPPSYQWSFNGGAIDGATNSYLVMFGVQSSNAGFYAVTVTNADGSVVSSNAALTLVSPGSNCESDTDGLVGWWEAEGDARNSVNGGVGQMDGGLSFVPGEVGQAFSFNGIDSDVKAASSLSLEVSQTNGFTIEAWINPSNVVQSQPLIEWQGGINNELMLWISIPPSFGGGGQGSLVLDLADIGNGEISTPAGMIQPNVWQHVAATFDKTSGNASVYIDGTLICQTNFGSQLPATSQTVWFGYDPASTNLSSRAFGAQYRYAGEMDEVQIYNRALSSAEVQATYGAGNFGLCGLAATTVSIQPTNEVALTGNTATFTAIANGSSPLYFQWFFNGTNALDATDATLNLTNAQPSQSGTYSVQVSNAFGSIFSSNVTLIVSNPTPPVITLQPANETAAVSNSVTFQVTSSGTAPLYYQWTYNGANIPRGTNSSLTLSNVLFTSEGTYSVSITNMTGATLSSNATLTVYPGWTTGNSPTNLAWSCLASSADGTKLYVGSAGNTLVPGGKIYRSADSGATWLPAGAPTTNNWSCIACSSDGIKLAATGSKGIYLSTNSGTDWIKSTPATGSWVAIAGSSDGNKLVAAVSAGPNSGIYTSTNSGATWVQRSIPVNAWNGLASSADGNKLTAVASGGVIYVSTNSGANWNLATNAPSVSWSAVASSVDGVHLFAIATRSGLGGTSTNAGIYASTNSGMFWAQLPNSTNYVPPVTWTNIVCSADGRIVVAAAGGTFPTGNQVYISVDSGNTWRNAGAPIQRWSSVGSSADGSKLIAAAGSASFSANSGVIYTWSSATDSGLCHFSKWTITFLAATMDGLCASGEYKSGDYKLDRRVNCRSPDERAK